MASKKMNKEEWAREIEKARRKSEVEKGKEKAEYIHKFIPVTLIIGVVASILMILLFGWRDFLRTALSWVIGVTIVTTIVATFAEKFQEKLLGVEYKK